MNPEGSKYKAPQIRHNTAMKQYMVIHLPLYWHKKHQLTRVYPPLDKVLTIIFPHASVQTKKATKYLSKGRDQLIPFE